MRIVRMVALLILLASLFIVAGTSFAQQETCPDGGGWTKIDSDDLSLYPVEGATAYCFKAGSDSSQGCTGGLFDSWPQPEGTCGLSHWSYYTPQGDDDDDTGDDDDDDVCPWDPQLPVDSDECQPPGDDDDDTGDDDDDDVCPWDETLPPDSDLCQPPGDDDDDVGDDDDGPTPLCKVCPYDANITECRLPDGWEGEDPWEFSGICPQPPAQPGEGETGLFDEEESEADPKTVGIILAVVVVLVVLAFKYLRSGNSEQ